VRDRLAQVAGRDTMHIPSCWEGMVHKVRNLRQPGMIWRKTYNGRATT